MKTYLIQLLQWCLRKLGQPTAAEPMPYEWVFTGGILDTWTLFDSDGVKIGSVSRPGSACYGNSTYTAIGDNAKLYEVCKDLESAKACVERYFREVNK